MKRLVFCYGWYQTLDCFTTEMIKAAKKHGFEVLDADICTAGTVERIENFIKCGNAAVIMFNNCGLLLEKDGQNIWEKFNVPIYDLLVDHPRFFPVLYERTIKNLNLGVVDRNHVDFAKRYLNVASAFFYQQGGIKRIDDIKNIQKQEKNIDILIIGSCQPENLFPEIQELPDGGEQFFVSVVEQMLKNPDLVIEDVIGEYFSENDLGFDDDDMKKFIFDNAFVPEVYVRRYYKHSVLKSLSKENFNVEIYGENWEIPDFELSGRIHIHEKVSPEICFSLIARSKIVINFMPWFKDGSHPRVYDSQLNGAVCFSDRSRFLEETQEDGKTIVFFDYLKRAEMIRKIKEILNNDGLRNYIAEKGFENAESNDTWESVFLNLANTLGFAEK